MWRSKAKGIRLDKCIFTHIIKSNTGGNINLIFICCSIVIKNNLFVRAFHTSVLNKHHKLCIVLVLTFGSE